MVILEVWTGHWTGQEQVISLYDLNSFTGGAKGRHAHFKKMYQLKKRKNASVDKNLLKHCWDIICFLVRLLNPALGHMVKEEICENDIEGGDPS